MGQYKSGTQLKRQQVRQIGINQHLYPDGKVTPNKNSFMDRRRLGSRSLGLIPYVTSVSFREPKLVVSHVQVEYTTGNGKDFRVLDKPRVIKHYKQ